MKPVNGPPTLFSLNGFGLGMAGRRAFDADTGTYIKSHCITALFIPVFALGAYRVADAEGGGWYFIGKEEKSMFAKLWNTMLVAGIATAIGLVYMDGKKNSPEYKAAQKIEQAAEHAQAGEQLKAAAVYKGMIAQGLPSKDQAKAGLQDALTKAFASDSPDTVVAAIEFADGIPDSYVGNTGFIPGLGKTIDACAERFAKSKPEAALRILTASAQLPVPPEDLPAKRQAILETLVQDQPANSEFAITLAGLYEQSDRINEADALLKPHMDKLGTGEGSRILGQILLAKGQPAEAIPLLEQYIEPRLKEWRTASNRYDSAAERAYQRVITKLENNKGPAKFYADYDKAATDEEKGRIVDDYVYERMQRDANYLAAGKRYEKSSRIVPVIMDLGISQLQAAQTTTDPAVRKNLLDKSEKQFLSLKDTAGDSGDFKFFLGQVYYWSGRQAEGRALFDELLAASSRDFHTLLTLASTLREIGNVAEARTLAEEAYGKAVTEEDKNAAAGQRAVMNTDIDDQIAWLEKITGGGLNQTTRLAGARAQKAMETGDTAEAIKQLRISEDGWSKLPVSAATLNNGALVQFELFGLTGDITLHQKGSRMMERAVALSPENSILLGNAASSLSSTALMQIMEGKVSPRLMQEGITMESLRFFYRNEAERKVFADALAANDDFDRAMKLFDRAILLSPNSKDLYSFAFAFHGYLLDLDTMERVVNQARSASFDHSEGVTAYEEFMRGDTDAELRDAVATGLKHQQELLAEITDEAERLRVMIATAELRMSLFRIGDAADLDQEITFLQNACGKSPSTRTSNALVTALSQRACLDLAAGNAAFAKYLKSARRVLDAKTMLALALTSDTLKPLILANPDAKAALTEDLRTDGMFPTTRSPISVVLATALAPDQVDAIRNQIAANRFDPLQDQFTALISPWSPHIEINQYIRLVAEERTVEAKVLLDKARAAGKHVPLL